MWWQILPSYGLVTLLGVIAPIYVVKAINWVDTGRFDRREFMTHTKAYAPVRDEHVFGNYWVKSSLDLLPDAPKEKEM